MKDFFYYSMIRSKEESTTKTRKLDGTVPLDELPYLMRAMGYYPTEKEVENMKAEVKFSVYADQGDPTTTVNMETFIRLFVNHRPVYGIGNNDIEDAFKALASDGGGVELSREELTNLLRTEGEHIPMEELQSAFGYLVGKQRLTEALPKDFVTAEEFASDLLGFEEYEEGDDEADLTAGAAGATMTDQGLATGAGAGGLPDVIPEEPGY
jgi:Ca2+-binding EF-hand superfamily protein